MNFYRYEDVLYYNMGVKVNEIRFVLVKETPKGYWIKHTWDNQDEYKKWVSNDGKKRHAYPTKEEALINFKARKNRQIKILSARLENAKNALYYVENNLEKR
jgi:uncharacterized DUF497 family protein